MSVHSLDTVGPWRAEYALGFKSPYHRVGLTVAVRPCRVCTLLGPYAAIAWDASKLLGNAAYARLGSKCRGALPFGLTVLAVPPIDNRPLLHIGVSVGDIHAV